VQINLEFQQLCTVDKVEDTFREIVNKVQQILHMDEFIDEVIYLLCYLLTVNSKVLLVVSPSTSDSLDT